MTTISLPILVAVLGLLTYLLASNEKVSRVGLVLFGVGTFTTIWLAAGQSVRLP